MALYIVCYVEMFSTWRQRGIRKNAYAFKYDKFQNQ